MTDPEGGGPTALRERWRAESLDSIWLRPGDWYHPTVEPLACAVACGALALDEAEDLGRARADVGVGIGEALDDLVCLYRVADLGLPPLEVIRALAVGWSDAQAGLVVEAPVVDAETGLPLRGYLEVRLAETYGEAVRLGRRAGDTHRLVVVDVAVGEVTGLLRAARSAAVGAALREVFGLGHPCASLGGGVFAALVPRDDDRAARVAALQVAVERRCAPLEIGEVTRRPVRIREAALPDTHEAAKALLGRLARAA